MSEGSLKLTGGSHRGRPVRVPPGVRPTGGRVREALFSSWQLRVEGARFLDLFAGSGAVGLEAAGRGAAEVVCVDNEHRSLVILEHNRRRVGEERLRCETLELPAGLAKLANREGAFDLIFADPPYRFGAWRDLLEGAALLLTPSGEMAVEHSRRAELPAVAGRLRRRRLRRYGESCLSFYSPDEAEAEVVVLGGP